MRLPRLFAVLLLAAGAMGVLRAGFLLSRWSLYRLAGVGAVAVIERCEPYQYVVRKPRPSRSATGYRGTYGYDVAAAGRAAVRHTGSFDSRRSLGPNPEACSVGGTIPVRFNRFDPSSSRPTAELSGTHLLLPAVLCVLSLFALLLAAAVARLGPVPPARGAVPS